MWLELPWSNLAFAAVLMATAPAAIKSADFKERIIERITKD
jgi:hypothetical protein